MKRKGLLKKIGKAAKRMGREFRETPLARAARGKRTKGFT